MAVRHFDGISDRIVVDNGIVGQLANGAFTELVLAKPTTWGSGKCFMGALNGSNWIAALLNNGGAPTQAALADDGDFCPAEVNGDTTWQVLAVTCTGPGANPRFHRKQLGSGVWTHANSGTAFAGNVFSVATFEFASMNNGSFSSFMDMRLAVAAVFTSALSDGQIESIESTHTTVGLAAFSPASLWEFNQASVGTDVTDYMGNGANQTTISGTTVITGDDPAWTFSGATPGPADNAPFQILGWGAC